MTYLDYYKGTCTRGTANKRQPTFFIYVLLYLSLQDDTIRKFVSSFTLLKLYVSSFLQNKDFSLSSCTLDVIYLDASQFAAR